MKKMLIIFIFVTSLSLITAENVGLLRGRQLRRQHDRLARTRTKAVYSGFSSLIGCVIIADDGTFLGIITTDNYSSKSILNKYGNYGDIYSDTSIFNDYSKYGGNYSDLSAFNSFASKPPRVYKGKRFMGYLTTNKYNYPYINTHALIGWLKSKQ